MTRNDSHNIDGLTLPEEGGRSLVLTYLKIILIPLLIYAFFVAGYLKLINLKVEIHSIILMGFLLFMAFVFARHNAEMGCCVFERKISRFKAELKEYIMSHLLTVGNRKKSNAPFSAFADNFTYNLRNDNYAGVAAGVFPMLGILGTFISISLSMPNFSSSNIDALESEIAQLLGGVGTAFYVSIYGIFLALWWIYFEKKGLSKFERLLDKYKSATKDFFWDKDEISQSLMLEILNRNEKVADTFEKIFNTEFNEKLRESMHESYVNFNTILDMQKNSIDDTRATLNESSKLFYTLEENSIHLTKRYEKTINSLESIILNTNEVHVKLINQLDKFSKTNEQNIVNFEESINRVINEFSNLRAVLSDANKQIFNTQNEATKSYKDSIKQSVDELKGLLGSANDNIALELKKSLDNIDKESRAIIEKIEKNESR